MYPKTTYSEDSIMTVTVDDLLPATKRSLHRRKLQLLMPEDLHARIQAAAKERQMSMNRMLIELLSKIFPAEAGTPK